ncbi:MAG: lactate utilization protein [Planctomycetaceae bacterium]|jgi:L-lactate utilization protein LutC|nr:lactate utilization protein [Planctomycetaceae bacterium]
MTNVKEFLGNIRKSILTGNETGQRLTLPSPPKVWQGDNDPVSELSQEKLLEQFLDNLDQLKGESFLCSDFNNLVLQIAKILNEENSDEIKIMVSSNPIVRRIADQLQSVIDQLQQSGGTKKRLIFYTDPSAESPNTNVDKVDNAANNTNIDKVDKAANVDSVDIVELSNCSVGIAAADMMLSDTGSGVFQANSRFERLTIYLPPISIAVADRSKLSKNLPASWETLSSEIRNQKTGEFVIVTGPSRTADIEKVLILGVHGPKRVLFMIYDSSDKNDS